MRKLLFWRPTTYQALGGWQPPRPLSASPSAAATTFPVGSRRPDRCEIIRPSGARHFPMPRRPCSRVWHWPVDTLVPDLAVHRELAALVAPPCPAHAIHPGGSHPSPPRLSPTCPKAEADRCASDDAAGRDAAWRGERSCRAHAPPMEEMSVRTYFFGACMACSSPSFPLG